jgi:S1-C subfamily serine protease
MEMTGRPLVRRCVIGSILCLFAAAPSFAQSVEERAAARAVVAKRADAVVVVLATFKLRINVGGREQATDQAAQTNGTILDASGLTVFSLQQIQPDEAMTRMYSRQMQAGSKIEVTSEPSDIRMHLADGRELAAKLVLRDEDLDLAFIRPTEPLTAPLAFVDAPTGKPAMLDTLTLVRRTNEATGWIAASSFANVEYIIDKPRTYYQVAIIGGGGAGSPLFDLAGRFVGVLLMRDTGTRGATVPGVLPADDIRLVAKQAPAAR